MDLIMNNSFNCPCQAVIPNERDDILNQFAQIREYCPALKKLLIPDIIWEDFKRKAQADFDNARIKSILLLAFERGYLKNITSPLHTYLIEGDRPKEYLKKQYVKDLIEKWMFAKGRLDDEFLSTIKSLSGRGGSFDLSLYATSDFLLFKAYTAAKQLETNTNNSMACLVISCITWPFVYRILDKNWMKWKTPKFFNNDPEWQNFFKEKKKNYPEIDKDLHLTINSLNKLYILKDDNFNYSLKYIIDFD